MSLRVSEALRGRIEASAAKRNCSVRELFRLAIESYLERDRQRNASDRRHLRVSEYTQVALDAIIRENYPELRETLVQETDRRMKAYHGAG